jgi:hypothetical protein
VGRDGAPLGITEKKKIVISENEVQGRNVWGVEFHPDIQAFEFEEVFQILGDVIRGIAQNARARKHEALKMKEVAAKVASINERERK